ncbi:hypothetical protein SAMN04487943_10149 [Gracilibacillus orientalis]|uniref:Uncharacterized protein n=2 Tax=Gracilibacillus orientalis TaxID=334253 RepID=A0A1I4GXI2_9BACI|nr:hypothetical protein SAMN04487943_10149 [Gracilibacillus orientalis]
MLVKMILQYRARKDVSLAKNFIKMLKAYKMIMTIILLLEDSFESYVSAMNNVGEWEKTVY